MSGGSISRLLVIYQQQLRYGCNLKGFCVNYRFFGFSFRYHPSLLNHRSIFSRANYAVDSLSTSSSAGSILLYKNTHSQTRYFRILFFLSGIQLIFWVYLSHFAFTALRSDTLFPRRPKNKTLPTLQEATPTSVLVEEEEHNAPWYSSLKWRLAFSLLALGVGVFFTTTACMYPLRVVQSLSYIRGKGGGVSLTTFSPLKGVREIRAELSDIGMAGDRIADGKGRQLGMKVKGHRMFYLIDRAGEFPNPKLFDTLLGVRKM